MPIKIIHNQLYNHLQALLEDSDFIKHIIEIKKNFIELGCGLPPEGLKDERDFDNWLKKYWDCREKTKQHPEIFSEKIRQILLKNNIKKNYKDYFKAIRELIFFNKIKPETFPLYLKETLNKNTKNPELFIQIFSHTTQEDIKDSFDWIMKRKKEVFKNIPGPKVWERKERDLWLNNIAQRLSKHPARVRKAFYGYTAISRIILEHFDDGRFGQLSTETINQALFKVKKYKKEL